MDENKDAVTDEPIEGAVVDAEAGESAEEAQQAVEQQAEQAASVEEGAGEEADSADRAAVSDEPATTDDSVDDSAAAGDEEPAPVEDAPGKEGSSFASMADLVIVGIIAIILGVLLALPSFLGMTSEGEKSEGSAGAVAATVNGVAISEDEITKYVMDFRSSQGLESDDEWGKWMVSYGYTADGLRSDTVDYFVNRELLKQAIAEQGIQVEDSKVDEYIASITEQVGGEEAFAKALEEERLDLGTYREEILFSLQQQALMEQVAPADSEVDDAQVLEIVKMYFPDTVDENATSLDGVDKETVEQVRSMLQSSAAQQAFSDWMDSYREKAKIVIVDMPATLPYVIDLAPYEEAAKQAAQDGEADELDESEIEIEDADDSADSADGSSESASAQSK